MTAELGSYVKVQGGYAFKSKDFGTEGIPVIKIANVTGGGFVDLSSYECIQPELYPRVTDFLTDDGDVLIAMTGANVGKVVRVSSRQMKCAINQRVGRLLLRDGCPYSKDFFYYLVSSPESYDYFSGAAYGSAQPNISGSLIEKLPLPSITPEQANEAAKILRAIDDKIHINQEINQTLEQMAQAIFKSWFVDFDPVKAKRAALEAGGSEEDALLAALQVISGKTAAELARFQVEQPEQYAELRATAELFPSAMQESELGEIPEGWFIPTFEQLTTAKQGKYIAKDKMSEAKTDEFPVPVWGGNGILGYAKIASYEIPVVLMTCRGSNCGLIRYTESEAWVSNNSFACLPNIGSVWFLLMYFRLSSFDDCVSGSAQPQITHSALKTKFLNYGVSDEICQKFSELVDPLFERVLRNKGEISWLTEIRDTLLPKLLSGELPLPATEEPLKDVANG